MDKIKIIHHLELHKIIADRIANERFGVLFINNKNRQFQVGDLVEFEVLEEGDFDTLHDIGHILPDMIFKVVQVISNSHIQEDYVCVVVKYFKAKEE